MMTMTRLRVIFLAFVMSVLLGVLLNLAYAQTSYPTRPIKLIAPFPPGGTSDLLGRMLAQKLSDELGQPVIIENRPGASGNIGHEIASKAAPDGYTLLLSNSSTVVNNPFLYKQMNFDWYKDFSPISLVAIAGQVLIVHPSVPAKNVAELTALAKAQPGVLNFGSGGKAIQSHISGEMYKTAAGVDIIHVPYKGTGVAVADVVAGQIQMIFSDMAPAVPFIKANKVRALAVTSPQRTNTLPDVPTMVEAGFPNFDASVWWSIVAPRGTSNVIIDRVNLALSKIMVSNEIKESFEKLGVTPLFSAPAKVFELSRKDSPIIGEVMKRAGVEKE
ncbi:Bug family tripartite tricarboxylate transporter substrate binding protein [Polynucleobacter kasalickyi]|uniref:Tripartite-type tricarboxylate transporter, receptor component TctC n=1 Tax=Polynucleobacter kasalickyi TaxID=1938817 RepID=A0A1W2ALY7_9BURK|nr:tripartite tricarboxylate transporter substrate binding protein [Polynucleobacter kasalickyi]SMC61238.1 Tripartite-type tricarboxylate transporter, receptor component TctC [Polynucleobacter kasalickyi]